MSIIVPCLYNSYSFTSENMSIISYDIVTKENSLPDKSCVTSMPIAAATATAMATATATASDLESNTDLESNSDMESNSDHDSVTDRDSVQEQQFHPDMMKPYAYTNTNKHGNDAMKKDTLLWSMYIMIYGVEQFETIENYYTEANRFKFELIELLRENKTKLKANKLKLSGIEESLVHKPFITLETFHGIAVCKSLSVYIVQGRKFYDINDGGDIVPFIIEKINGHFGLYLTSRPASISNYIAYILTNYWRMESISAPIRPISAYKLQDLIDISTKLGLPVSTITPGKFGSIGSEKRKTKPELYEAICRCL